MPEQEERKTEIQTVTVGLQKGGKTFRAPPEWSLFLRKLVGKIPLQLQKCDYCTLAEGEDSYHLYIMRPDESPPICTETVMFCPCGCGKSFRYDKREQQNLMEKSKNARHN